MTMTRDEFDSHVLTVFSSAMEWRGEDRIWWPHGSSETYEVSWCMGGMSGGNCWGDDANYALDPEPEPDMPLLDKFLEEVSPQMTVKQYKMLLSDVVQRTERTENEYYGNYTHYGTKRVQFDHLYHALVHMGVI